MTFIEHIISLRNENKIPKIWNVQDIKPFLENYFSSNTINVYPANCSITSDGKIKGDYVKKGQKPKFYRLGKGLYVLIDEYESPHDKIINSEDIKKPPPRFKVENNIDDLIDNFAFYLDYFNSNNKFSGPSTYFHQKTIGKIRAARDYNSLLDDTYFLELLYATLVSWGMHTMGKKGPKMAKFEDFKAGIAAARQHLIELQQYKLHTLTDNQFNQIKPLLRTVFEKLKTMASGSRLVGNSKVIHHLLPDLAPPIDRTHTLKFFYGHMYITKGEIELFVEFFEKFIKIARSINAENYQFTAFNTSIPKIIDNAIMGFVMRMPNERERLEGV
jgi:hypothetical protein